MTSCVYRIFVFCIFLLVIDKNIIVNTYIIYRTFSIMYVYQRKLDKANFSINSFCSIYNSDYLLLGIR